MDLTACPHGEGDGDRTYLGNTNHRSDTSEMSCRVSAPTLLPTLGSSPKLLLSLQLMRALGFPNAHALAKLGPQVVEPPTQRATT